MAQLRVRTRWSFWSSANQLLLGAVALSLIGLLFVFEASAAQSLELFGHPYHFVRQQSLWLVVGLTVMIIASFVPPQWYRTLSPLGYGISIGLLALVFVPGLGVTINGAKRWIHLPGFSLQPIEVVKLALVLYFSDWLSRHQRLRPLLSLTGIPVLLLLLQPDLDSALIVVGIAISLYFLAGGQLKSLAIMSSVGLLALIVIIAVSPYRRERVETFFNLEADPLDTGFHVRQITLALGSGGWLGQGLGKSRQKFAYIPEVSNDSIFAIVAEETGFLGATTVIALFGWFVRTLFVIMKTASHNRYLYLVAAGVTTWIVIQLLLNLASVVVLVPLSGLPLPFFSYGGSALVMLLLAVGITASTARSRS